MRAKCIALKDKNQIIHAVIVRFLVQFFLYPVLLPTSRNSEKQYFFQSTIVKEIVEVPKMT
jgi:hypothetical protein